METIKISRIGGEFINPEKNEVLEYLNPYTGENPLKWYEFEEGKKVFDSVDFSSLKKKDIDNCAEYYQSEEDSEKEICWNYIDGYKPLIYLFTFEIPLKIWNEKEKLALKNGYDDDFDMFISDFSDYNWVDEETKEVVIPKSILKKYK